MNPSFIARTHSRAVSIAGSGEASCHDQVGSMRSLVISPVHGARSTCGGGAGRTHTTGISGEVRNAAPSSSDTAIRETGIQKRTSSLVKLRGISREYVQLGV